MLVWFALAWAGGVVVDPTPPPEACETSARWDLLDESELDVEAAPGLTTVSVAIGCRFLGVPGAVVDLGADASLVGMEVLGIRRSEGVVLVQATPDQAATLRGLAAPVAASLVRDGDWLPLIYAMEGRH